MIPQRGVTVESPALRPPRLSWKVKLANGLLLLFQEVCLADRDQGDRPKGAQIDKLYTLWNSRQSVTESAKEGGPNLGFFRTGCRKRRLLLLGGREKDAAWEPPVPRSQEIQRRGLAL
jgi:hypothetical protein